MKLSILKMTTIVLVSTLFMLSCSNDKYGFDKASLTKEQKELLKELSRRLKSDSKTTLNLLSILMTTKASFEEIPIEEAKTYFDLNEANRRPQSELLMRGTYQIGTFKETKSIVVPIADLFQYALAARASGLKVGTRIVFGSYPFDTTAPADPRKSGQMNLFFLTTVWDDAKKMWRDSINQTKSTYPGFSVYNHGELCPSICGETNFQ
jgi:hypothetical protein